MNHPMLSRYRILGRIGSGGMGVIYRAEDSDLGRQVALKVLPAELADRGEHRSRFLREARTAASLNHPNICTIHEVRTVEPGQDLELEPGAKPIRPGTPYIAMELIEGETLQQLLKRKGALPVRELLNVSIQVADGLAEAHSHGIVHRDLNPKNLMITREGRVKILDFGLAAPVPRRGVLNESTSTVQTVSTELVEDSKIVGTVAYLSPEQALAKSVDGRSDLFAFGTVLYEMATGRRPFQGENATSTIAKILEAEPDPPRRIHADFPVALERVIRRCLQKRPEARYRDTREVLSELKELRRLFRARGSSAPTRMTGESSGEAEASIGVPLPAATIAVFPFSFRGSEQFAYLREGLVDLLSTKMDGAGELHAIDAHVVIGRAAREGMETLIPDRAREIAHELGAGVFVIGNILEAGGQLHLDASLYDPDCGEPAAKAAVRGEGSKIFDLVDALTTKLLAERCGGPSARLIQIGAMTTGSFAALKAYLEGEREMRLMRRVPAVESFRRAVEEDPRFALAWYRMSVAALWSGQPEIAREAVQRGVEHGRRLSPRDHRLLTAFQAVLRGSNDEAEHLYRSLLGTYPDDAEAWYQLGELLFHWGPQSGRPLEESREAWERLIFLDPRHVNAHLHLAIIIAKTGRRSELEASVRRILDLGPGEDPALWVLTLRAFALGDGPAQEEAMGELRRASDLAVIWASRIVGAYLGDLQGGLRLSRLLTEPVRSNQVRAIGHVTCAHLELARGRWDAARAELDSAAKLRAPSAQIYRGIISVVPSLDLSRPELEQVRSDLERWDVGAVPPPVSSSTWFTPHRHLCAALRLYLVGLLSARLGDERAARKCADDLDAGSAPEDAERLVKDFATSVRAQIASAAGRMEDALCFLQRARMETRFDLTFSSPFWSQAFERYARAEAFRALGRWEESLCWYGSFAESSIYDLVYLAPSHFRASEIHEQLGRWEEVLRHCDHFLEIWSNADGRFQPWLEEARARRARAEREERVP